MIRTAIVIVSDKGSRGERVDESGDVIREMIASIGGVAGSYDIIPDEEGLIAKTLVRIADTGGVDLILTSGGTGVSPRDVTPEATSAVVDRELPGMAEAMRAASLQKTPRAMISRAVAGIRKKTLIVNLPGSPRAVRENLAVILPALPHALEKIQGSEADCAAR